MAILSDPSLKARNICDSYAILAGSPPPPHDSDCCWLRNTLRIVGWTTGISWALRSVEDPNFNAGNMDCEASPGQLFVFL